MHEFHWGAWTGAAAGFPTQSLSPVGPSHTWRWLHGLAAARPAWCRRLAQNGRQEPGALWLRFPVAVAPVESSGLASGWPAAHGRSRVT